MLSQLSYLSSVEVVGVEPTRLSDLIYSQASQPNAQHFLIFCAPYRDRTCDLLYVKQPLLPSELRVLIVSPTGFEPVTPPLKAECSETNWATRTLSKWQGSNLRPDGPKPPALPSELHLDIVAEEWGVDPHTFQYRPFSRRGHRPLWLLSQLLLFPKGSNLNSMDQNHVSCQLDEGTIMKPICQRTFLLRSLSGSNWWLRVTKPGYYQLY